MELQNKIDAYLIQINFLKNLMKNINKNEKKYYLSEVKFLRNKKSRIELKINKLIKNGTI